MAYENLCMYCFKDLGDSAICPHCGKDANAAVPQIQLLPGSRLHNERFLVGRSLGQDSSGIVYNALDTRRGNTIKIREYLPRNCAERLNDGGVVPIAGMEDAFETGMRKLKASIENTEDSQKKHYYFEENGTAYIAQRRSAAVSRTTIEDEDIDDEPRGGKVWLFAAIGAVVVAVIVVAYFALFSGSGDKQSEVLPSVSPTADPVVTWKPAETPTPTPYVTPTFEPLVDPELSWYDFATAVPAAVNATATPKPSVNSGTNYSTVNQSSTNRSVQALQERLAELGWLDRSRISGNYDNATTQAVMNFQEYVNNNCSPAQKLKVDGIAGSKTQQWMYDSSVALYKPTPSPAPVVTAAPDTTTIKSGSSSKEIKSVQRKLIKLGLLSEGSADGKYGTGTKAAVRKFQTRVNELLGYDVLEVTGTVDELTMAYLNYYVEWWEKMVQATATPESARKTPTPSPTRPAATPTATATPTAAPELEEPDGGTTISKSSTKTEIRSLQEKLVAVGLLDSGEADGIYGKKTVTAVKSFQTWINTNRGTQTLEVTGVADPFTLQYIDYCVGAGIKAISVNTPVVTEAPAAVSTEVPTAEPTEEPTAKPTEAPTEIPATAEPTQEVYEPEDGEDENDETGINASSEPESIRYMQEMLNAIRLLPADSVSGAYDSATTDAVRTFQMFVNKVQGKEVVEVTGICDVQTQKFLQYAFERNWDVGKDMGVDIGGTSSSETSGSETQTPDSDAGNLDVVELQQMLLRLGLSANTTGTYDAATEQAVLKAQRFINSVYGEGTLPENGNCDDETLQYIQKAAQEGWNMADTGDMPGDEDTAEDEEPTQIPVSEVANLNVSINNSVVGDTVELEPGKYTVAWSADGVQCWSLYLYTQDGSLVNKAEYTSMTSFKLDTSGMVAGATYEMRIGAIPNGGTADDIVWRSLYVKLKEAEVTEAPVPEQVVEQPIEEPVYEEPVYEEPTEEPYVEPEAEVTAAPYVGAPVITIGSSVYQQGGITYISDSTVIFAWMADGDVASYDVALIYEDGTRYALGTTNETSKTVNAAQLKPGMYTLVVAANPVGGGEAVSSQIVFCMPNNDSSADEDEPSEQETEESNGGEDESTPVNTEISNIQMALYRYGMIDPDSITQGVLDYETLAAVAEFQQRVNEAYGYNLPVLNPGSATSIDLETINVLLNERPAL